MCWRGVESAYAFQSVPQLVHATGAQGGAHLWDDGMVGGGREVVNPGWRQRAAVRHCGDELAGVKGAGGVAAHVEARAHLWPETASGGRGGRRWAERLISGGVGTACLPPTCQPASQACRLACPPG